MSKKMKIILGVALVLAIGGACYYQFIYKQSEAYKKKVAEKKAADLIKSNPPPVGTTTDGTSSYAPTVDSMGFPIGK